VVSSGAVYSAPHPFVVRDGGEGNEANPALMDSHHDLEGQRDFESLFQNVITKCL
jgi:hypothetical protein